MSRKSKVPDPSLLDREVKVLELRRAGLTWQRISEETGYATSMGAYQAYQRAVKRTLREPANEVREQELDRLDRLQLALWNRAMQSDEKAILTIIKIMERRSKLLGLDMPIKIQQDVTVWEGESIDKAVRDLAALLTLNDANGSSESSMGEETGEIESITGGE